MKKHEELFKHRNGFCSCLVAEYEQRNEEIIKKYINNELSIRETLQELNKSLGSYLVKESNLKNNICRPTVVI
jgi:hypothetical protein